MQKMLYIRIKEKQTDNNIQRTLYMIWSVPQNNAADIVKQAEGSLITNK